MHVVNIAIDVPLYKTFSYLSKEKLDLGQRVLVEFAKKQVIGFVWDDVDCHLGEDKLNQIIEVYPEYLSQDICDLIKFTANYYHYPVGATIFTAIPKALKLPKPYLYKPGKAKTATRSSGLANNIVLNQEQKEIVEKIAANLNTFYSCILYGITGSGKTEVYLELISKVIKDGGQVLVMVPEINLTPQLLERFVNRFPNFEITVLTSHATDKVRSDSYFKIKAGLSQIVIGTRLSVFTSFKNLGLIIIDEEHDQSFKQNDTLRYHARDLAIWRANYNKIPIILGSATPSLESLYNYKLGRYQLYKLTTRGVGSATLPLIELIDLKIYPTNHGLTEKALNELKINLARKELSMVFINRRGYSPVISCYDCGWISKCKYCSTTLVYHRADSKLMCHHCGFHIRLPKNCPACNSLHLQTLGEGTQKIEEYLQLTFPEARIYRIDRDTIASKKAWSELYTKIHKHEVDILVGTQMLAKGHDFHNLTLVIGVNIDNALFSYDFRASEGLFTQLTQVSGRAGRGLKPGRVFLQTRYPEHELYEFLLKHDFSGFVNYLLTTRKEIHLPPYTHYAILRASGRRINQVLDYLVAVSNLIQKIITNKKLLVETYPPVPSIIQRLKNKERGQILLHSEDRKLLHQLFSELIPLLEKMKPRFAIKWSVDVDPYDL